jgi:hypothetical protein
LPTNVEGQFVLSWGEEREIFPSESTKSSISEIGPDGLPLDAGRRVMPDAFTESKGHPSLSDKMHCKLKEAVLDLIVSLINSEKCFF